MVCIIAAVITLTRPKTAEFEVSSFTLSSTEAKVGESVTVFATVRNTGDATGTYRVPLKIDGEEVEAKEVTLEPRETEIVTFTLVKDNTGTFTIGVGGVSSIKSLEVNPLTPAEFEVSNLTISPSEVEAGNPVSISVTVTNTGDLQGTYTVTLKINDEIEATEDVTLSGGITETVSFTVTKNAAGTYTIGVNGLQRSLSVLEPATFGVSNLTISPSQVELGESVTISVDVKNEGGMSGTYTVTLRIDGATESTQDITLAASETRTVSFTVTKSEAKSYSIAVDGLTGAFSVRAESEVVSFEINPIEATKGEYIWFRVTIKNNSNSEVVPYFDLWVKWNGEEKLSLLWNFCVLRPGEERTFDGCEQFFIESTYEAAVIDEYGNIVSPILNFQIR